MNKKTKLLWAALLAVGMSLACSYAASTETHTGVFVPGPVEESAHSADATTNAPTVPGPALRLIEFLSSGSNWMAASYATWSPTDKKAGGGIAALARINDFAVTGLRLDYYDGDIWMPSVNFQIQVPFRVGSRQVTPFVVGGLATPLSGKGDDNGEAVGIIGVGLAVELTKKVSLVTDVEKWTRYDGQQYRLGLLYKF